MKKISILFIITSLTFISCIINGKDDKYFYRPTAIDSIKVIEIVNKNVSFLCYCTVGDPCWKFYHTNINKENNSYFITITTRKNKLETCIAVVSYLEIPVDIKVDSSGFYNFHFWTSDTTSLDTTLIIQ